MLACGGFKLGIAPFNYYLQGLVSVMTGDTENGRGLTASWTRVRERLRSEYGEVAFANWLNGLDVADFSGDSLVLSAPSRFMRDWVAPRYGDRIRALWRLEDPSVRTVDIRFVVSL